MDLFKQKQEIKLMTYTFYPEMLETFYNPKIKKSLREFEKNKKDKYGLKVLHTDFNIFQTEKVNRAVLEAEQPPLNLNPGCVVLRGHSIELEKEGLIFNLYDYIN